jgi:uncharacterized protein (DUF4415 family)
MSLKQRVIEQRAKDTKAWQERMNKFVRQINRIVKKQHP